MAETAHFFVRGLWLGLHATCGVICLLLGSVDLFGRPAWWQIVLSAALIACGLWNCYVAWLARQRPMVTISKTTIEMRSVADRRSTRIPRADVTGLAWWNAGAVGLRLRSGATATINMIGLSPKDRAVIRNLLEVGGSGA